MSLIESLVKPNVLRNNILTVRIGNSWCYRFRKWACRHKFDEVAECLPIVCLRSSRPMCGQPRLHSFVYHKVYHSLTYAYIGRHDTFVESQDTLKENNQDTYKCHILNLIDFDAACNIAVYNICESSNLKIVQ